MKKKLHKTKTVLTTKRRASIISGGFIIFLVAVVGVTLLVNQSGTQKSTNLVAQVRITKHGFIPATLAVKPGTKVVWVNDDQKLHQVMANPFPGGTDLPGLKSEILNDSQSYSYVANTAGSFGYHDQLHPTINGTILVKK